MDLELLVFELQKLVVIIYLLGHLSHRLEVLVELFLSFFEVVLISLLALSFGTELLLDVAHSLVELLQNFVSLYSESLPDKSLCLADLFFDLFKVIGELPNAVAPELVVHKLCVLLLDLPFLGNYFCLLAVMDVDPIEEQVVFIVDFVVYYRERMRRVVLLLLK